MTRSHDVVVLGVGGMGSAAACYLARRGLDVRAFERFVPGHDRGSSHGLSRIIRLAYFEHPSYVPLLHRAFALWRDLERECGRPLLHVTGALDAGLPDTRVFTGSLESCRLHRLRHEVLSGGAVSQRFPGYRLPDEFRAVFQPDGGFLEPEHCIAAFVAEARRHGAVVEGNRTVRGWTRAAGGVVVDVDGEEVRAGQLVACGGAWTPQLVPSLAPFLRPERQVVGWFGLDNAPAFSPARFPVFVMEAPYGTFYGFPEHGVPGFKIGKYHHRGESVDPDTMDRTVSAADEAVLRDCVRRAFPGADGPLLRSSTCIFTNTPDEHFIVDRLPEAPEVVVVSACSGHGFKFCSVVGEVVADLVTRDATAHDISLFRLARLAGS